MRNIRGVRAITCAGVVALVLSGCTPIVDRHGYAPSQADLETLIVGVDSRDSLRELVGPPSASGIVNEDAWYYVQSVHNTRGFTATKEVSRTVVAVSFDDAGTISNIEQYGLEDGRVIVLNRRVTDDNIKGVSFIAQLLGNVGNFTAEQFLDN